VGIPGEIITDGDTKITKLVNRFNQIVLEGYSLEQLCTGSSPQQRVIHERETVLPSGVTTAPATPAPPGVPHLGVPKFGAKKFGGKNIRW